MSTKYYKHSAVGLARNWVKWKVTYYTIEGLLPDFQGLELWQTKFKDFQGFQSPIRTLLDKNNINLIQEHLEGCASSHANPAHTLVTSPVRGSMMRTFLSLHETTKRLPSQFHDAHRGMSGRQSISIRASLLPTFQMNSLLSEPTTFFYLIFFNLFLL